MVNLALFLHNPGVNAILHGHIHLEASLVPPIARVNTLHGVTSGWQNYFSLGRRYVASFWDIMWHINST